MAGPIKPEDMPKYKAEVFPEFVFQAFNLCIVENFCNGRATVYQKDVMNKMASLALEEGIQLERGDIFSKGYLNVEDVYREAGWKVKYDSPAYCETYEAHYEFKE
jgi:hypothetical protein